MWGFDEKKALIVSGELEPKEKAEALRALCEGAFKRRGELEILGWKMNFSLWTAIILSAWALHNKPEHLGFASLFFVLVIPIHSYVVYKFTKSIQQAVSFAMLYLHELEKLIGITESLSKSRRTRLLPWHIVEIAPTVLLVIAAVRLVW
jgi:hypothetical protein